MKRIANITFHGAYNFGSNLQAYALQESIKELCPDCEYKIINLRTDIQKNKYKSIFEKKGIKNKIKRLFFIFEKNNIKKRNNLFENFIQQRLNITKEVKNVEEIEKLNCKYDFYISGSDQIWNLKAIDFDWANYLEFVNKGKKISYAASFGPTAQVWSTQQKERIKQALNDYSSISVREVGSYNNVVELLGREPEINIDPTFLINEEKWLEIINTERLIKEKYILLYDLKQKKDTFKLARKISKKLKLPVIIINGDFKAHLKIGFKHYYACGPLEFLNLIKNAELVLSSSFHGTVFSIIFKKKFFSIDGMEDFRMNTLLTNMKLTDRSINIKNISKKMEHLNDNIDFSNSIKVIESERHKSLKYLYEALEIK